MNRQQFIDYLKEHEIPYNESGLYKGYDGIYAFSKKETEMTRSHPRKYKDLFVPYIRVSNFEEKEDRAYVRNCGVCSWENWDDIIKEVNKLGA